MYRTLATVVSKRLGCLLDMFLPPGGTTGGWNVIHEPIPTREGSALDSALGKHGHVFVRCQALVVRHVAFKIFQVLLLSSVTSDHAEGHLQMPLPAALLS